MFNFIVYNRFKFYKWEKMSPEKRLINYQRLERIQAKKLDRPECLVVPMDMEENMRGQFDSSNGNIYINMDFLYDTNLVFEGMATLFHEGRHAFQYYTILKKDKLKKHTKAYKWYKNFKIYDNGEDVFSFYTMQPVEQDANRYALSRLKDFAFRYRHDRLYRITVDYKERELANMRFKAKEELGFFYRIKLFLHNRRRK